MYVFFLNLFVYIALTVVGGWANNRTLIRRKRQDHDMTVEYNFNVLRKDDPLKLLIEISNRECKIAILFHIFRGDDRTITIYYRTMYM